MSETSHVPATHASTSYFASSGIDGNIRLWNTAADCDLLTPLSHGSSVWALSTVPQQNRSDRLASGGVDGAVRIWDLANGVLLHVLWGHANSIHALATIPSGEG